MTKRLSRETAPRVFDLGDKAALHFEGVLVRVIPGDGGYNFNFEFPSGQMSWVYVPLGDMVGLNDFDIEIYLAAQAQQLLGRYELDTLTGLLILVEGNDDRAG